MPKAPSNLDAAVANTSKNKGTKRREGSLNGVPVGVKGLAAISDLRNNSKTSTAVSHTVEAKKADRDASRLQESATVHQVRQP